MLKYSEKSDVSEMLRYIPKDCGNLVKDFIYSLDELPPKEALNEVNKYVKNLILKGVLAKKTEEEVLKMKEAYNKIDETVDDAFEENYENLEFSGEGYSFIEGEGNPYLKTTFLKTGEKFESPDQDNADNNKEYFLNSLEALLFEFYYRYEDAVKKAIKEK